MKCQFLIILIMSISAFAEIKSPRPEISVQGYNEVNADRPVLMRDLAIISFAEPVQIQKVMSLQVIDMVGDGEKIELKSADLIKTIKQKINNEADVSELKWTYFIPEKVIVQGRKNFISDLGVQSEILLSLQKKYQNSQVTIRDLKVPRIREKQQFESCQVEADQVRAGSFLIPVNCQFPIDKKTYWVTGVAKISKVGPIAARQINPGEKISAQDVRMESIDLTFAKDSVPTLEEIQNQIAGRSILVNQPIFKGDLKKEVAITRGQIIRAISGNESFEVSSQMQAEEQGYIGDLIRIKNTETQKILSGQIIEKGVVRVE